MPNFLVLYWEPARNNGLGGYEGITGPNSDTSFTANDGADANGLAAIASRKQGKFVSFNVTAAVPTTTTFLEVADSMATTL